MKKKKRPCLPPPAGLILVALSLLAACSDPGGRTSRVKAGNVVLIVIDALRPDHLGFNGYREKPSPYLDSIAEKGLYFSRAYSQESYTQASTPSLFTSRYPTEHKVLHDSPTMDVLAESFTTIAEVLSGHGFSTAAFVFNPHLKAEFNLDQGFDLYDDNKEGFVGKTKAEAYETASKIRRRSLAWLKSLEESQPFFLYLHYRDVHTPYEPPAEYLDKERLRQLEWRKDGRRLTVLRYDAEIAYTDNELKTLIGEIERLRPETLFIITADHGEAFWEHGEQGHGYSLYEEEVRIPLLVHLAGAVPAQVVSTPVESIDIAPTILHVLGVPVPEEFRGVNLLDVARNPAEGKEFVFSGGAKGRAALIRGDMKYYRYRKLSKGKVMSSKKDFADRPFQEELYDISKDPGETVNIIEAEKDLADIFRKEADKYFRLGGDEKPDSVAPDEETIRRLKALGYL